MTVLGFGKGFVIAIFIGVFFWIGTEDYTSFLYIMGGFIIVKIIWNILT